ncbi:MAG: ABC transporter permease [Candidatus Thermoplasmatota archaeon]|nr:ABC transporter permease [Candidatus Thermoplasmatota archaeon]
MATAFGGKEGVRQSSIAPRIAQFRRQFYYFKQSPLALAGLIMTSFFVLLAIFSPVLTSGNPYVLYPQKNLLNNYIPWFQSWRYPLGTTYFGINLLPAIIKAARVDLGISLAVVLSGATIGILLGAFAGYKGGVVDDILMRITDIFFSIPFIVTTNLFVVVFRQDFDHVPGGVITLLVVSFIIIWWPTYARLVRGQVLSVRELKYVEAAKASGSNTVRTVFKHIIPNSVYPVFVQMSLDVGSVVLLLAALDYINIGINFIYLPEWGNLATYFQYKSIGIIEALQYPWTFVVPGMAILLYSLGLNLLGDGLRDILDPRMRR